jgi:hypothetical protein
VAEVKEPKAIRAWALWDGDVYDIRYDSDVGGIPPEFSYTDDDGCVHDRAGLVLPVEIRPLIPRRKPRSKA